MTWLTKGLGQLAKTRKNLWQPWIVGSANLWARSTSTSLSLPFFKILQNLKILQKFKFLNTSNYFALFAFWSFFGLLHVFYILHFSHVLHFCMFCTFCMFCMFFISFLFEVFFKFWVIINVQLLDIGVYFARCWYIFAQVLFLLGQQMVIFCLNW